MKSNNIDYYQDVKKVIKSIADNLEVAAENVYSILLKQQLITSITILIVYILYTLLVIYYSKFHKKRLKRVLLYNDKIELRQMREIHGCVCVIITIIGLVLIIFYLEMMLTGFFNPDYGAIYKILKEIK